MKLRKGNVFTSVCQEFCLRGCLPDTYWQTRQTPPLGRHPPWQADTPTQQMATATDGMHPTEMHSCFEGDISFIYLTLFVFKIIYLSI